LVDGESLDLGSDATVDGTGCSGASSIDE
jgi:hypothetical protein